MQIRRLRLLNFRQHADTELELGPGLTGIVGPNGAGKTTLLEAIAYALYGTEASRGTKDSIRRRGAPPRSPVRVELEFALGPTEYRIVRGLNQAELYLGTDPAPVANSLGAVTDKATQLLGMTRDEFFNTYFTGQKELAVMAALSAPERAKFLSRVLGYERIRQAQDRLKVIRSSLKAKLEGLRAGLVDPAVLDTEAAEAERRREASAAREIDGKLRLAEAAQALQRAEPEWKEFEALRERVLALEGEGKLATHKVQAARDNFKVLDLRLVEAMKARDQLEERLQRLAPLDGLREERERLDRQAEAHAAKAAYLEQAKEVSASVDALVEAVDKLPGAAKVRDMWREVEKTRKVYHKAATASEQRRTDWVRDAQDAATNRKTLEDQYRELQKQRNSVLDAGADGRCPTCDRPLGDEFDHVLQFLEQQLKEVEQNGRYYRQRIEQLKNEPAEVAEADASREEKERLMRDVELSARRLEELEQQRPDLDNKLQAARTRMAELEKHLAESATPYDKSRHEEVRRLVKELEAEERDTMRLRVLAEQAEQLVAEAEAAERELSRLEAAAAELEQQLASTGYSDSAFEAARSALEQSRAAHLAAERVVVQAQAELKAAQEALESVERRRRQRAETEGKIEQTAKDLRLRQELDRALTDLRTDLNASLRPELSDQASVFIRELTNDRYSDLELDEDYRAILMEDGQAKPVVSGGEEDVANLALRLAISQMIAERAGQPLSLLVLDEIFGSLDEERRGAVLELLRGLADRFPQVVLITHIESVREGFDRVVRVSVDEDLGVAVVREESRPEGSDAAA